MDGDESPQPSVGTACAPFKKALRKEMTNFGNFLKRFVSHDV